MGAQGQSQGQQAGFRKAHLDTDRTVVDQGPEGDAATIHALLPCLIEAICGIVDVIVAAAQDHFRGLKKAPACR